MRTMGFTQGATRVGGVNKVRDSTKKTVNGVTSYIMTTKDEVQTLKNLLQYKGSRLSNRYF